MRRERSEERRGTFPGFCDDRGGLDRHYVLGGVRSLGGGGRGESGLVGLGGLGGLEELDRGGRKWKECGGWRMREGRGERGKMVGEKDKGGEMRRIDMPFGDRKIYNVRSKFSRDRMY